MNVRKWARAYPKLQLMDLAIIEFIGEANEKGVEICQRNVYEYLFMDRLDCEFRLRLLFAGRKKKRCRKFHLIEKSPNRYDKRCNDLHLTSMGNQIYNSIKRRDD